MAKSTLPKPGPWLVKTRNITSRRNFESASRRATRRCMMDRQPWNKNRRRERRRVTTARTERGRWWWQREKGGRGGTRVTYGFSWKTRKKNKFRRINSIRGPAKLLPSPFCLIFFSSFRIYIYTRRRFLHKLSRVCRGRSVAKDCSFLDREEIFKSDARFISRLLPCPPCLSSSDPILFLFSSYFHFFFLFFLFYICLVDFVFRSWNRFEEGGGGGASWKIYIYRDIFLAWEGS